MCNILFLLFQKRSLLKITLKNCIYNFILSFIFDYKCYYLCFLKNCIVYQCFTCELYLAMWIKEGKEILVKICKIFSAEYFIKNVTIFPNLIVLKNFIHYKNWITAMLLCYTWNGSAFFRIDKWWSFVVYYST